MKKVLIIGSDGRIGKKLLTEIQKEHPDIFHTSYKSKNSNSRLDLVNPNLEILEKSIDESYSYGIIAAGITSILCCEKEKKYSYLCNVEGTLKIARLLHKKGIIPVIFSSDYVFDGKNGNYTETSALFPLNEYGKQKKILEERLVERCQNDCLIIRLSKVYDIDKSDQNFMNEIVGNLLSNKKSYLAQDQIFCPLFLDDLIGIIFQLLNNNSRGLFNICGNRSYSRYDLGIKIAKILNVDANLIEKISIDDLSADIIRPKNTTMRNDKMLSHVCINFKKITENIQTIIKNYDKKIL